MTTKHRLTIQNTLHSDVPSKTLLRRWATAALPKTQACEMTIRLVDILEMTLLNQTYRKKEGPTNVLSFPADLPRTLPFAVRPLGDIVICAAVVNLEAKTQHKPQKAHWAHMVVHGVLHLQGYDHQNDGEAEVMEELERGLLGQLGFDDPYRTGVGPADKPRDDGVEKEN